MQSRNPIELLMIAESDAVVRDLVTLISRNSRVKFSVSHLRAADFSGPTLTLDDYDACLLDTGDDVEQSLDTVRELRLRFPELPLIIISDRESGDCFLSTLRYGAQDCLTRQQLDGERLAQSVQFAIERLRFNRTQASRIPFEPRTGFANRLLLHDRLKQAISRSRRNSSGVAILDVSFDNFGILEQRLGSERAGLLLRDTANEISHCLRGSDTLARIYKDEIVILLEATNHIHGAVSVSGKILGLLQREFELYGENLRIDGSIGISLYPQCGEDIDELIRKANISCCRARREGGSRYDIYTEDIDRNFLQVLNLEDDLAHALERNEFELFYQPKYCLGNGRIYGAEALLRWQHPARGLLLPHDFLHLIEDKEVFKQIGSWVLQTACATNRRWHENGLCVGPIAVNIAGKQILDAEFTHQVEQALLKSGLPSCLLELEITEGTLIDNVDICSEQLRILRDIGVSIAIDDFGTGYCSFNYLKNFLIDTIKIDRSFIEHICKAGPESAITTAIIRLARDLKLNVVAEGVENIDQFRMLYDMTADGIQGNLLSPAMSANSMHNFLVTNGLEMNQVFEPDLRMAV